MNKKALFLGAGFSKSINNRYPTLSELTQQVLKGDSWLPSIENTMYAQCYAHIPAFFKTNLETLLNYLNQEWPWIDGETYYLHHALYLDLLKRIIEIFDSLKYRADLPKYKFFAEWICNNHIDIVTLNYDTLVEEIIDDWHRETDYKMFNMAEVYSDGGILPLKSRGILMDTEIVIAQSNEQCRYFVPPHIYKLHGSVNWKWAGKNQSDPIYCSWDAYPDKRGTDLIPYIIPPVNNKQLFYGHTVISSIWKQAFKALVFADELYVIGFSFPFSDTSLQYMFNALLLEKQNLKVFVINTEDSINPQSPHFIRDRYETVFGKKNCDFSFCCNDSVQLFLDKINNKSI